MTQQNNRNMNLFFTTVAFIVFIIFLITTSSFIVVEGQQAAVLRFGKPIRIIENSGLKFKFPFIDEVRYFDVRMQIWNGTKLELVTSEKTNISVDTTARWRINDVKKYLERVQRKSQAQSLLSNYIDTATADVIAKHRLVQSVRNSNDIFQIIQNPSNQDEEFAKMEQELASNIERIPENIGRENLTQQIAESARLKAREVGIELIDVLILSIRYQPSVEQNIFHRMISERKRIADKIRSTGKGEQAKIEGQMNLELQEIQSQAYKEVQSILGEAEAKATSLYAENFSKDIGFYEFTKKMDIYSNDLPKELNLIMSNSSDLFKQFQKP